MLTRSTSHCSQGHVTATHCGTAALSVLWELYPVGEGVVFPILYRQPAAAATSRWLPCPAPGFCCMSACACKQLTKVPQLRIELDVVVSQAVAGALQLHVCMVRDPHGLHPQPCPCHSPVGAPEA